MDQLVNCSLYNLGAPFRTAGPAFKAANSSTPCTFREGGAYMGGSWRVNQSAFLAEMVGDIQFTSLKGRWIVVEEGS